MFVFDREQLDLIALRIIAQLEHLQARLVLAESCTGGEMAAAFTRIPGASGSFCGSFVTYRPTSKIEWLGVNKHIIKEHTAESQQTANAMAITALEKTPEANVSLAAVGHLEPPGQRMPPFVIAAVGLRTAINVNGGINVLTEANQALVADDRAQRQYEACAIVLRYLYTGINDQQVMKTIQDVVAARHSAS